MFDVRRNSMRKSRHKSPQTLEEHQKNIVVNPYVVPQLYSLYRLATCCFTINLRISAQMAKWIERLPLKR